MSHRALDAEQQAASWRRQRDDLLETLKLINSWLLSVANCDMDEVVADGGVTAAMVVRQEAGFQQTRARAAIARATGAA